MEQNRITPQRKMIEIIIKIVIVYNYQYVILFFLRWWSIQEDGSMLENHNKIKIDQKGIRLGYFWFYGENVRSWVILWGEMFPSVSEMCFKKHYVMVCIQGSSLLIYNTGYLWYLKLYVDVYIIRF